jgi:hypothetical protein
MKKIIILIAILCSFGFCKFRDTVIDGLTTIVDDKTYEVQIIVGAFMSCGQEHYDFNYDRNTGELTVWRPCEGTLLFKGKTISLDEKGIEVDGYCYDKNGMKETKHVNRITKCK